MAARTLYWRPDNSNLWSDDDGGGGAASNWENVGAGKETVPIAGDTVMLDAASGNATLDDDVGDGTEQATTPVYALVDMTGWTGTLTTDAHLKANNVIIPATVTIVAPHVHTIYLFESSGNVGPISCAVNTRIRFAKLAGDTTLLGDLTMGVNGRLIHYGQQNAAVRKAILAGDVHLPSTLEEGWFGAILVYAQNGYSRADLEFQGDITGNPTVRIGGNNFATEPGNLILTAGKSYALQSVHRGDGESEALFTVAGTVEFNGNVDLTGITCDSADPAFSLVGTGNQTVTLDGQTLTNVTDSKASGEFNVTVAGDGNFAWNTPSPRIDHLTIDAVATQTNPVYFDKLSGAGTLAGAAHRSELYAAAADAWNFTGDVTGTGAFDIRLRVTSLILSNAMDLGTRNIRVYDTGNKTLTIPGLTTSGYLAIRSSNNERTMAVILAGNSSGAAISLGIGTDQRAALTFGSGFDHEWTGNIARGGTGTVNALTFGGRVEVGGDVTLAGIITALVRAVVKLTPTKVLDGADAVTPTSIGAHVHGGSVQNLAVSAANPVYRFGSESDADNGAGVIQCPSPISGAGLAMAA